MLDLLLLVFFGFRLHRLATAKGFTPRRWVGYFVLSYFLICVLFAYVLILAVGMDVFADKEKLNSIAPYLLIPFFSLIGLFFAFKYKLDSYPDAEYYDEEPPANEEPPKKDLSYFR